MTHLHRIAPRPLGPPGTVKEQSRREAQPASRVAKRLPEERAGTRLRQRARCVSWRTARPPVVVCPLPDLLLVPQSVDRIQPGRLARRVEPRKEQSRREAPPPSVSPCRGATGALPGSAGGRGGPTGAYIFSLERPRNTFPETREKIYPRSARGHDPVTRRAASPGGPPGRPFPRSSSRPVRYSYLRASIGSSLDALRAG